MMKAMETSYKKLLGRLFALCLLIAAIACSSDDTAPIPDPEPTRSELIAQSWIVSTVTIGGQNEPVSGYTINFQSNGNFNFTTPGVPSMPSSGTWVLNSSGSVITLNGSTELTIRTLTSANFAFDYSYQNHKEGNVPVQIVLSK